MNDNNDILPIPLERTKTAFDLIRFHISILVVMGRHSIHRFKFNHQKVLKDNISVIFLFTNAQIFPRRFLLVCIGLRDYRVSVKYKLANNI